MYNFCFLLRFLDTVEFKLFFPFRSKICEMYLWCGLQPSINFVSLTNLWCIINISVTYFYFYLLNHLFCFVQSL